MFVHKKRKHKTKVRAKHKLKAKMKAKAHGKKGASKVAPRSHKVRRLKVRHHATCGKGQ